MWKYISKRILMMIPVLLGVIVAVFTINYISPGDPVYGMLGVGATEEQAEALREELGLNNSYIEQLWDYLTGLLHADFGTSYQTKKPVIDEILQRFPTTFKLGVLSIALSVIIGIPLGILSATHQNSVFDYISSICALIGAAMPGFWLALILLIVFSVNLKWFPVSGLSTFRHWVLPTIAVGVMPIASIMRTTRSSMLEVVRQDYCRTARAKGMNNRQVIFGHALKNALIPVVTVIGLQLGLVLGGTMVLEAIFNIPGLGMYMYSAIAAKNYPAIQGCVLFCAIVVSLVTLCIDLIYAFIDPRIKSQYVSSGRKKNRAPDNTTREEAAANG